MYIVSKKPQLRNSKLEGLLQFKGLFWWFSKMSFISEKILHFTSFLKIFLHFLHSFLNFFLHCKNSRADLCLVAC